MGADTPIAVKMERYQDLVGARLMGYKFSDADVQ
jgi:hypothetical protein